MNHSEFMRFLDGCYNKALMGIGKISEPVSDLAEEYIQKYPLPLEAAHRLAKAQIVKCGTSGFLTGLGGVLTLPVAIPANIASVIYVQLRMIAYIAYIVGHNPSDDEVRTMAYVCLTGSAAGDILKQAGIKVGEKLTVNMIKKIPGTVLTKINQKVGFKLLTKYGEKGVINFVKLVPFVGGAIGGGIDISSTKVISNNAIKYFVKQQC